MNEPGDGLVLPKGPIVIELGGDTAGRLRPWLPDDAPVLVQAWADPEVARWNPVPPEPTLATASRWIAGEAERRSRGLAVDLVIDLDTHGVAGEVGLSGFDARHRGALIGYWLLDSARGHGSATIAVAATAEWAFDTIGLAVLVARCHPDNPASHGVASRAGFRHETTDSQGLQVWTRRRRDGDTG